MASSGQSECTPCVGGTYSNDTGLSSCAQCLTGTYSGMAASTCIDCNPGMQFLSAFDMCCASYLTYLCIDIGTYAGGEGLSSCTSCAMGQSAQGFGNAYCTGCIAGESYRWSCIHHTISLMQCMTTNRSICISRRIEFMFIVWHRQIFVIIHTWSRSMHTMSFRYRYHFIIQHYDAL